MTEPRDEELFAVLLALAGVADTHRDSSVVDTLLDGGRSVLRAHGAVVILGEDPAPPRVVGSSSRAAHDLALVSLQHGGPTSVAHEERRPVSFLADGTGDGPWPRFTHEAGRHGIQSVFAVPVAVGTERLGAYALLWRRLVRVTPDDRRSIAALGRMAAVGLVNRREVVRHVVLEQQLQHALESRVLIEQAKGMLAERAGIDPTSAFELMRSTARAGGRRLTDVAADVLRGLARDRGPGDNQRATG
jgi:hypothetical protein